MNYPYFPCQTEDGRTYVMRGSTIVHEVAGFDTMERWRTAQLSAITLNKAHHEGRLTPRDRIAIIVGAVLMVPVVVDMATGGWLSEAIVKAFVQ